MIDRPRYRRTPAAPWHALLAPLPVDAIALRRPVAPPEVLETPHGSAIAGWEQLTIVLSAGLAGLRHVMVVLDASGQPVSASDTVLYRSEAAKRGDGSNDLSANEHDISFQQESIGGRIEPDGSFRGTRWETESVERAGDGEPRLDSRPFEPTAAEIEGIKALVVQLLRRQSKAERPD